MKHTDNKNSNMSAAKFSLEFELEKCRSDSNITLVLISIISN